MQTQVISVTQLNEYIKMQMDNDLLLGSVMIRGELSNFTNHYKTGHFYFSLKDESAAVRGVMFRSYAQTVAFVPENGMKVIVHGRVSVFPRDGQYQIYVDEMLPDGVGALYLAYEQLRRKLEAEGLFDEARKRLIPRYPSRIGVITSPTGAAVRDILQILGRRYPAAEVVLYPALVQGSGAPQSLLNGLSVFASQIPVDVIIIGRGGGSAEDLFCFNDEALARAVAASPVPVISAVGHETDFTICDFVADLRAPTPSAAAELAVPDASELKATLLGANERLYAAANTRIMGARATLSLLSKAEILRSPLRYLDERRMALAYLEKRMEGAASTRTQAVKAKLGGLAASLDALNPLRVLSRGYAAVFDGENKPLTSASALSVGQKIQIRFANGSASATVGEIRESE